jgi:lipopolysaccharide/colanic/teichoic acid biosynthesis glycosyltransferase
MTLLSGTTQKVKRWLDIAVGLGGLAMAAPALAVAGGAILITDGGPVLFRQERLGLGRRPFVLFKLRTMRGGAVAPLGRWLREWGIDELPQLVNIVRGDMSLVGPRPLTLADVERLGWSHARYDARWTVRPGLSGPGQLRLRGPCDARVTWRYDRRYARHASLRRDIAILAASGVVLLAGKERARRLLRRFVEKSHERRRPRSW